MHLGGSAATSCFGNPRVIVITNWSRVGCFTRCVGLRVRKWQHNTRRLPFALVTLPRPNCPESRAIGWFNEGSVVTKPHLWGISHLGGNGIFVLCQSVEIRTE